jgi:serine/threonine-protein kinase
LYSQAADGTGIADRLTASDYPQWPTSITADGAHLLGFDLGPKKSRGVILVHMTTRANRPPLNDAPDAPDAAGTARLVETLFNGGFAEISPDGRYIAYQSNESGRLEVYVRPFARVDSGRWQISSGGATRAAWAPNGRELFYLDESNTLIAVPVRTSGPTFIAGNPTTVFDTKYVEPNPARHYDVSPDGRRFLMLKESAGDRDETPASMVVVLNWSDELQRRVPTNPIPLETAQ